MSAVIEELELRNYKPSFRRWATNDSSSVTLLPAGGGSLIRMGAVPLPTPGVNEALRIVRAQVLANTNLATGAIVFDGGFMGFAAGLAGPFWSLQAVRNWIGPATPIWDPSDIKAVTFATEEDSFVWYGTHENQNLGISGVPPFGFAMSYVISGHNTGAVNIDLISSTVVEWELWRTEGSLKR